MKTETVKILIISMRRKLPADFLGNGNAYAFVKPWGFK